MLLDALLGALYIGISFVLGIVYLPIFTTALGLGVGLAVIGIGLPILLATVALAWALLFFERELAIKLLGAEIPPLVRKKTPDAGFMRHISDFFTSAAVWKGWAFLALKAPLAIAAFTIATTAWAIPLFLVGSPFFSQDLHGLRPAGQRLAGDGAPPPRDPGRRSSRSGCSTGCAPPWAGSRRCSSRAAPPAGRVVRDSLAEGLRDETLTIAYWLPEQDRFVDEDGRPVQLPEPGSGRAWTPVEHDGELVAGIVHQDSLAAESDLVRTAGTAALLALENERLKADLRARLEELRASRTRIVEASDAARRQLERDIHDGAQQRLVGLTLQLRMARNKLGGGRRRGGRAHRRVADRARRARSRSCESSPAGSTRRSSASADSRWRSHRWSGALRCRSTSTSTSPSGCPPGSRRPPTSSSPRGSRTSPSTPRPRARWVRAVEREGRLELEVRDDGRGGATPGGGQRPPRSRGPPQRGGGEARAAQPGGWRHATPNGASMRVVIADDAVLLREGIARLLEDAGCDVVAQAGTYDELMLRVRSYDPDVAVVDIRMPPTAPTRGSAQRSRSARSGRGTGVLVLSSYLEAQYALELLEDGAEGLGYLLKDRVSDVDEFVAAVRRVAAGGSALDPEIVAQLVGRRRPSDPLGELTPREREVLELMAEGRSNGAIAQQLVVTERAIEKHVTSIFAKLRLAPASEDHRRVLAVLDLPARALAQPTASPVGTPVSGADGAADRTSIDAVPAPRLTCEPQYAVERPAAKLGRPRNDGGDPR